MKPMSNPAVGSGAGRALLGDRAASLPSNSP